MRAHRPFYRPHQSNGDHLTADPKSSPLRVTAGAPEPFGAVYDGKGVNFAVASRSAEAIFVSLFDDAERETARIKLPGRLGDVFHGHVAGLCPGTRYGLRAHGRFEPNSGHRFNCAKLLVDPFATRVDRAFKLDPSLFDARIYGAATDDIDSAPFVPKTVVEMPEPFRPPQPLNVEWRDLIIYEMHVRGFSKRCLDIPEPLRGTFAGLAHEASIRYLKRLGVTAVELLPIAAWIDERHLPAVGLSNYWGYNPISLLAPDPRLAPGGWAEVRSAVDALHAAGIAVILDVVFNHTGESDELGPTLSMRGLDNGGYYRLRPGNLALYVNDSGCGNVLALERPLVLRLVLDALRTAAIRAGVDGFRYDLAPVLGRREGGFDPDHPLLAAITQDPWLRGLIHIAEPWDLGQGGYRLGAFPAAWGEWNDHSRDSFRQFWRGDPGCIGLLATRLAGSADIFKPRRRPLSRSINFVTAHDGFTLSDLVAYKTKRNEANGEENRDGTNDNLSWNCGSEGPTQDVSILARRAGAIRALLVTLFAARGTPMLAMGDELGRSQRGNNNAYAQDNELTWIDWARADASLMDFVARLIRVRRENGALNAESPLTGAPRDSSGIPDVEWLTVGGRPFSPKDWNDPGTRTLVAVFYDPGEVNALSGVRARSRSAVLINGSEDAITCTLPEPSKEHVWALTIDSARPDYESCMVEVDSYALAARSVAILVEQESHAARHETRGAADDVLDALAAAAGIAAHWYDVNGRKHEVSADTKRTLLTALGLPASSTGEARASLALLAEEGDLRPLPVATTCRQGAVQILRLGGSLAGAARRVRLAIMLEDGTSREVVIAAEDGQRSEMIAPDGRRAVVHDIALPALPLGRHRVLTDDAPECWAHLAIVPDLAFLPEALGGDARAFGIATQLYALRREPDRGWGDQGIGDFTTLRLLAQEAVAAGAATVGLNPLHALFASDPERASPYHPSDRRFLDPLAIDAFNLPALLLTESVRAALEQAREQAIFLSAKPLVDYASVAALKNPIFDVAHAAFRDLARSHPGNLLVEDFAAFVQAGGESLRRFAIFTAIEVSYKGGRGTFPGPLQSHQGERVAAFAAAHEDAVSRAMFLQWLADRQFAVAARDCGLQLGFYRDLAVGCAPDGAEAWAQPELLMRGVSIGAPPDPLGPNGQIWNLPPYDPRALACGGFAAFGRLLAANMAHAGILRIDHVLGLERLFLIPEGAAGRDGAYLAYPFADLLGHLMLESVRAKTAVVGEDLGTVPEGLREKLSAAQILSYCVMRFEREGERFLPPDRYPRLAVACVATHDLPPLAGWWQDTDLDEAAALGHQSDAVSAAAGRAAEKTALIEAIGSEDFGSPPEWNNPLSESAAARVHGFVAASKAVLALVQTDDLAMETVAVNLPGTDKERPNWRRKLRVAVQSLFALSSAQAILTEVRRKRQSR
ncbi:MAG TPA: glycogen debranching protein GlgX [Methylocella sp.]|nr:glycogen debranching protein GlgX [Methylocella sp.]